MRSLKWLPLFLALLAVPLALWAADRNTMLFNGRVIKFPAAASSDQAQTQASLRMVRRSSSGPPSLTPFTPPKAAKENFVAHLSGRAMLPDPVNTRAQGQVIFKVNESSIHFQLMVANIKNVIMAHIHLTPPDRSSIGPVLVWLFPEIGVAGPLPDQDAVDENGVLVAGLINDDDLTGEGDIDTITELAAAMRDNDTSVVVHTVQNRPGEIRGEIH